MYIVIAIIGFAILGFISVFDKFILSNKVSSPAVYTFEVSIFSLFLVFLSPFVSNWPSSINIWLLVLADGLFFFLGLLFMFKGVKESEISHVGPLIGAMVPFFTFFFGRFFLHEFLITKQILAISCLIVGSLIISFEKSKKHNGFHKGMLWGIISGLFFAASHTTSKFLYGVLDFISGTVLIRFGIGLCGVILLFIPSVRYAIFKKRSEKGKKKDIKNLALVIGNTLLGAVATIITQYAISIGSVSVVNSLEGVRYGVLVVVVALLSCFYPKFFKEDYTRWEIFQEIAAIVFIGIGLWLLI